jgi:hypothetical protein
VILRRNPAALPTSSLLRAAFTLVNAKCFVKKLKPGVGMSADAAR